MPTFAFNGAALNALPLNGGGTVALSALAGTVSVSVGATAVLTAPGKGTAAPLVAQVTVAMTTNAAMRQSHALAGSAVATLLGVARFPTNAVAHALAASVSIQAATTATFAQSVPTTPPPPVAGALPVATVFADWLRDSRATRVILFDVQVRIAGTEYTRHLSTRPYTTGANDSPPNYPYEHVVVGGMNVSERVALDGSANLTVGDIELANLTGARDNWLIDTWANRPITAYIGDVNWPRSAFVPIFTGVVADIDSRAKDRINIKLRDKMQRLNTPVSERKLGGTTDNKENLLPLTFGEAFNVEPLLTNPASLEYAVHTGSVEEIFDVRANGVPVLFTKVNTNGRFLLREMPYGQITASVQGDKIDGTYRNRVAQLILLLAMSYGKSTERLTASDIDMTGFTAFDAAHTAPVGLYAVDRMNVIEAINMLAMSVGAAVLFSRAGLLQIVKIDKPANGASPTITADDMVAGTFAIAERQAVSAAVKLGYCRNWTPQEKLLTGIPQSHKDLYAQEWLTVTRSDPVVAAEHRLHIEPEQEDTLLLRTVDAQAEADRRLTFRKTPRYVVSFTGFAPMLSLSLGQSVTIVHERFNLSAGTTGIVVGLHPDYVGMRVGVEILI